MVLEVSLRISKEEHGGACSAAGRARQALEILHDDVDDAKLWDKYNGWPTMNAIRNTATRGRRPWYGARGQNGLPDHGRGATAEPMDRLDLRCFPCQGPARAELKSRQALARGLKAGSCRFRVVLWNPIR